MAVRQESETSFCHKPSKQYLKLLGEAEDDPRLVAGRQAIQDLQSSGGWAPAIDARDARVVVPVTIPTE